METERAGQDGQDGQNKRDAPHGCIGCAHFDRALWLGGALYVVCPKMPGGKSREVPIWRGCGLREVACDGPRQTALFE
jgi:hypothetical protein